MNDRVCVVTGANSGIGFAMTKQLAQRGARVMMVCRNREKGEVARARIVSETGSKQVELELADLASLSEVRDLARRLVRLKRVDVLMNNAGLYLPGRQTSPDGFEMMFAVNHLAPFLLTNLLRGQLAKARDPRVITTASVGHRLCRFDIDDLQAQRRYVAFEQYGVTKLSNILFTKEAARRYASDGIRVNCFHPGAVGTGFAQDQPGFLGALMMIGKAFIRSPEKGAETGMYLAMSPDVSEISGQYFVDKKVKLPSKTAQDAELARRLWERSAELTALDASGPAG